MQGRCCDVKFRPLFLSRTLKFPTVAFERFRKINNDKSCSLKLFERNCPALDFMSNFKTTTFRRMRAYIPLSQKIP